MASPLLHTCRLHRADPCEKLRLVTTVCKVSNAVRDSIKTVEAVRFKFPTHQTLRLQQPQVSTTPNSPAVFGITCGCSPWSLTVTLFPATA